MICNFCTQAADLNLSRQFHCLQDKGCTCQHREGKVLIDPKEE